MSSPYITQAAALYDVLGVTAPSVTLRPQVALLEPRHLRQFRKLEQDGFEMTALFESEDELAQRMASQLAPELIEKGRERLVAVWEEIQAQALAIDGNLKRPAQKTRDQILRAVGAFEQRFSRAAMQSNEVMASRLESLRGQLLVAGRPQERAVTSGLQWALLGDELALALLTMETESGVLQLLSPPAVSSSLGDEGAS